MINLGKLSKNGKEIILEEMPNGCIRCISHCKDFDGYTRIRYNGKHERLFRVLYEKKYSKIPKGLVVRHLCNNPWCCNVEHLKVGTQKENAQDMVNCGRSPLGKVNKKLRGIKNGANKLTQEQVKNIYLSKDKIKNLAKQNNVSETSIKLIKYKKTWSWLTDELD